jgi:ABC-2 type transport system permease protein
MTKWTTIAKHEYTYNVRRKEFLFVTLGMPLFIMVAMGLPLLLAGNSISHAEYKIGYVDKTSLFEPGNLTKYADEELAKKDLLDNKITHFFVIPANYTATGKITIFAGKKDIQGRMVESQIKNFLIDNLLKGENKDVVERVKIPMNSEYFTLNEMGETSDGGLSGFIVSVAFAVFFMLSIFTSSNFLLQGVVEEKENRVMEILLSSVSYRELLIGKILGLGAVGLTQILAWFVIGLGILTSNPVVFAILLDRMHVSIPLLLFGASYFMLGYLAFASIMAGLGAVATTSREGQQMAGIFSIIGVIPLIFSQFIITNPDATLTKILSYFPLTSPVAMIMRLSTAEVQYYEVVISTMILAVSAIIIIELSVKVFRASLLMYGKKPTLKEVIRYLSKS